MCRGDWKIRKLGRILQVEKNEGLYGILGDKEKNGRFRFSFNGRAGTEKEKRKI